MMKTGLKLALCIVTLCYFMVAGSSCKIHGLRVLQNKKTDTLSFSELPEQVVTTYENYFQSMKHPRYLVTDTSSIHVQEFTVVNPDFPRLGWSYGFYFKINGRKTFIDYYPVKGQPFVVDSTHIYWSTELNIREQNYMNISYVRKRWAKK